MICICMIQHWRLGHLCWDYTALRCWPDQVKQPCINIYIYIWITAIVCWYQCWMLNLQVGSLYMHEHAVWASRLYFNSSWSHSSASSPPLPSSMDGSAQGQTYPKLLGHTSANVHAKELFWIPHQTWCIRSSCLKWIILYKTHRNTIGESYMQATGSALRWPTCHHHDPSSTR